MHTRAARFWIGGKDYLLLWNEKSDDEIRLAHPYAEPVAFALVIGSVVAPWELSDSGFDLTRISD